MGDFSGVFTHRARPLTAGSHTFSSGDATATKCDSFPSGLPRNPVVAATPATSVAFLDQIHFPARGFYFWLMASASIPALLFTIKPMAQGYVS